MDFTHRLEAIKDQVNGWVGPTQRNLHTAPDDPAFFLNQAMVDKLWQEWEDLSIDKQTALPHGSWSMSSTGFSQNVIADQVYDSRKIPFSTTGGRANDVWYASQGKVLLDGSDGNDFVASDVSAQYLYRYTTSATPGSIAVGGGEIYVGDVQRDGNSIIADAKGGFKINPNVKCDFRAGAAIIFLPGYEALLGSISEAKIITVPNGLTPGSPSGEVDPRETKMAEKLESTLPGLTLACFPNPVLDHATFEYTLAENAEVLLEILDMTGKTISTYSLGEQSEGIHQFNWETGMLPEGLYLCRLEAGSQTQTLKVLLN
ncbi:MAG: T9SS type A sorting domain-containing protein [Phycisphaerae bacterium]|nr:T9SS type A sorting domain-containing protein [Saprospiraceae bacterium]